MKPALIRDGVQITRTFGLRHAWNRLTSFVAVRREERRRASQYKRLKRRHGSESTVVKNVLGSLMKLDLEDTGVHRDLFLDGIREPVATAHTMRVLRPSDVVLEVGANIGYYALLDATLCREVLAVEPHPDNARTLKENIALNQLTNLTVYPLAFGNQIGTAQLRVSARANWHTFRATELGSTETVEVEMSTVDAFLVDKPRPNFVRMDVEGFELAVVQGMEETLAKIDRLFIEVHSDILDASETRELLQRIQATNLQPELIVQHDRPGLSQIHPTSWLDMIARGDKGTYEIFFSRDPVTTDSPL